MNLRILKKLSKKAVPFLAHFQHRGEVFTAERGGNYHGCNIERPRKDRWRDHDHPLKGTPMVGAMEGYYEPEWEERTAWEELSFCVMWHSKPASMTDAEWEAAKRLARTTPVTDEEMSAWAVDAPDFDAIPEEFAEEYEAA